MSTWLQAWKASACTRTAFEEFVLEGIYVPVSRTRDVPDEQGCIWWFSEGLKAQTILGDCKASSVSATCAPRAQA